MIIFLIGEDAAAAEFLYYIKHFALKKEERNESRQ